MRRTQSSVSDFSSLAGSQTLYGIDAPLDKGSRLAFSQWWDILLVDRIPITLRRSQVGLLVVAGWRAPTLLTSLDVWEVASAARLDCSLELSLSLGVKIRNERVADGSEI